MRQSETAGQARVVLHLERNGEPIRGSISSSRHSGDPFHGWIEFADALETARRVGRHPDELNGSELNLT